MRVMLLCESSADFRTVAALLDRILAEAGPQWVRDTMEQFPSAVREFVPDGLGREFFDLHKLGEYISRYRVRIIHGHFDGSPGGAGAAMARNAFLVARAIRGVDAVLLIWDADARGRDRSLGLSQAAATIRSQVEFRIVCACANPTREAWVLAGFAPKNDHEARTLADLSARLGFSPVDEPTRLNDPQRGALRNIKAVVDLLTSGEREREIECLLTADMATLRARGRDSGLDSLLDDISVHLFPLLER